jgi:hypothetical protein
LGLLALELDAPSEILDIFIRVITDGLNAELDLLVDLWVVRSPE